MIEAQIEKEAIGSPTGEPLMTPIDFKEEIPQRAFIDAEVIQLASASGALDSAISEIARRYGLERYRLLGPAHVAGLLYCLIVVPRELWWSPELLSRLETHEPLSFFSFSAAAPSSVADLIRHLRNALAHADFSVSPAGTFTFNDRRDRTQPLRFSASIELPQLQVFLSLVGAEMANARWPVA